MSKLPNILELTPDALAAWLDGQGEPAYRLRQVLQWVYAKRAASFDEMTDMPGPLRGRVKESFSLSALNEVARQRSRDGSTEKFLFELADGEQIESVALRDEGRHTFCISSQAGCPLGCTFCATGAMGWARNLAVPEILGQVLALARARGALGNIVFMGMGEPLLNLDAVLLALQALNDRRRFGVGGRSITVSTAGITPGIRRLGESPVRPHLALSLNSPFSEQRSELMPVNRKYPLGEVLEACRGYSARTGRRVLLEYVLIRRVNTSGAAAQELARIARDLHARVNLIAFNPVGACIHGRPTLGEVKRFRGILEDRGVTVTQRYRRGVDIGAGCGQLRGRHGAGPSARH